jgi:hypothetical protein
MAMNGPYHPGRRAWLRIAGAVLPVALAGFVAMTPATTLAATRTPNAHQALSGGVLMAEAIRAGTVVPGVGRVATPAAPGVTILPNVQVSNHGTSPVNENPVAANPNNGLQLESGGNDYNCTSLQGFFNSDDGGNTWPHQHCMTLLSGKSGDGDPNVAYGLDGTAYILGIQAGTTTVIAYQKSTDNGVTWSTVAAGPTSFYPGGLTDKEWTEIDHTASSPFAGCIYTSITQFDSTFNKETITVDHSCNGGTTWSGPKAVSTEANFPNVNQFSDLAIGNDGTVYATWVNCTANGAAGDCGGTTASVMFSKSTDGGNTWSTPTTIHTVKLAADSCFCAFYGNVPTTSERVSEIPVIDVDAGSTLYVADYNAGTFMQGRVTRSRDGGTTWGTPINVFGTSTSDQFLNWLSVDDARGRVGVTYLLRTGSTYKEQVAISTNGGSVWKGNQALSTVASSFSKDGFGGGFMGDYTGNIWAGNTLHAVYMDTRTNVCQDEWTGVAF